MDEINETIFKMINEDENILCIGPYKTSLLNKINQTSKVIHLNSFAEQTDVEQIIVKQYDDSIFQKDFNIDKIDVILVSESIEVMRELEKLLLVFRNNIKNDFQVILIIKNFCHFLNRIRILNGELNIIENDGKIQYNQNIFNLKSIVELMNNSRYSIKEVSKIKTSSSFSDVQGIKEYTVSEELVDSIIKDPEALISHYIIKVENKKNELNETRKWISSFPNTITTERLKEWIEYYKTKGV